MALLTFVVYGSTSLYDLCEAGSIDRRVGFNSEKLLAEIKKETAIAIGHGAHR